MNDVEPPPTRQGLRRVAEIFHGPVIQVVQVAFSGTTPDDRRNRVDEEAKLTFALTKRIFRALLVVDVSQQDAPPCSPPVRVADWEAAVLHPAIGAIRSTHALHDLVCRA